MDDNILHILLIGDTNLRNQSISEIICSELGYEIEHISPGTFYERSAHNPGFDTPYRIVILDLTSFDSSPQDVLKLVRSTIEAEKLIVSHIYNSPILIDPLLQNGADDYLPWDVPVSKFLEKLGRVAY